MPCGNYKIDCHFCKKNFYITTLLPHIVKEHLYEFKKLNKATNLCDKYSLGAAKLNFGNGRFYCCFTHGNIWTKEARASEHYADKENKDCKKKRCDLFTSVVKPENEPDEPLSEDPNEELRERLEALEKNSFITKPVIDKAPVEFWMHAYGDLVKKYELLLKEKFLLEDYIDDSDKEDDVKKLMNTQDCKEEIDAEIKKAQDRMRSLFEKKFPEFFSNK